MELEDVDERVEWEARRVAAAFGVEEFEVTESWPPSARFEGFIGPLKFRWRVERAGWYALYLSRPEGTNSYRTICQISKVANSPSAPWNISILARTQSDTVMARGLYRLGFEDEGVLTELNAPLTTHEKLEARLSMPREFWPEKWLEKEGT